MARTKTYSFTIPIFYVKIKVIVGQTFEDVMANKMFTHEDRIEHRDSAALCFINKGTIYVAISSHEDDVQYMVHEIVHAKNYLYKMRGIQLDVSNDENEAYLIQHIYQKCMEARRKFINFVSKQRDNETIAQQGTGVSGPGCQIKQEDFNTTGGD